MMLHPTDLNAPERTDSKVIAASHGCRLVHEAAQRLLQRTALLLASTPGGLLFEPGASPWLADLIGAARRSSPSARRAG